MDRRTFLAAAPALLTLPAAPERAELRPPHAGVAYYTPTGWPGDFGYITDPVTAPAIDLGTLPD